MHRTHKTMLAITLAATISIPGSLLVAAREKRSADCNGQGGVSIHGLWQ
jgi:hypothetical protein